MPRVQIAKRVSYNGSIQRANEPFDVKEEDVETFKALGGWVIADKDDAVDNGMTNEDDEIGNEINIGSGNAQVDDEDHFDEVNKEMGNDATGFDEELEALENGEAVEETDETVADDADAEAQGEEPTEEESNEEESQDDEATEDETTEEEAEEVDLDAMSKDELYEFGKEHGVSVNRQMNKEALTKAIIDALGQ